MSELLHKYETINDELIELLHETLNLLSQYMEVEEYEHKLEKISNHAS